MRTGRGLETFDSREVYAIAAHLVIESSQRTEEEVKSRDTTIGRIRSIDREQQTGMPAVTELYRPANELYPEGG